MLKPDSRPGLLRSETQHTHVKVGLLSSKHGQMLGVNHVEKSLVKILSKQLKRN